MQNDLDALDRGKRHRIMKVGCGGWAVTDPAGRNAGVALDRRGHCPADGLRKLRAEVAGNREEILFANRIHHWQLPALETVGGIAEQLAHHVEDRPVARDQQALLTITREQHRSEEHTSELKSIMRN